MKTSYSDLSTILPSLQDLAPKALLHIGCGRSPKSRLPLCFQSNNWTEVRLDVDPIVRPDIVADITNMYQIRSNSFDAIWSSHNLEHLEDFDIHTALVEIKRVLKPGAFALATTPDLQRIASLIVDGKVDDIVYTSPAGPIRPIDMLFGHRKSVEEGNSYMAHRTGFTRDRLAQAFLAAGFAEVRVMQGKNYDLWCLAVKAANNVIKGST